MEKKTDPLEKKNKDKKQTCLKKSFKKKDQNTSNITNPFEKPKPL